MNTSACQISDEELRASAAIALSCLDLTSLNDQDGEAEIATLCQRAQGRYGAVAAVCVWPRLAAFARANLPAHIAVAAVANFPDGSADRERAVRETASIVQSGAEEVDVVLPYTQLRQGQTRLVAELLGAVRKACPDLLLKVILETGELQDADLIAQACRVSLDAGADFLKTSTGKTAVSATPQAAHILLSSIASDAAAAARVGFKPSGGIRTVRDAITYMDLQAHYLGTQALQKHRFRIGASGILSDIEAILGQTGASGASAGSTY